MTTPVSAATSPALQAQNNAAASRRTPGQDEGQNGSEAGGAFSSVLKLKLGMGLKTAMPGAQSPRTHTAKPADRSADPAPARGAARTAPRATPDDSAQVADDARGPADLTADGPDAQPLRPERREAPAKGAEPARAAEPVEHDEPTNAEAPIASKDPAKPTPGEPVAEQAAKPDPAAGEATQAAAAQPAPQAVASASAGAAVIEQAAVANAAKVEVVGRRAGPAQARGSGGGASGRAAPDSTDAASAEDSQTEAGSASVPGAADAAPAPRPTQARDPLGLIRTPVEALETKPAATAPASRGETSAPEHARSAEAAPAATTGAAMPGAAPQALAGAAAPGQPAASQARAGAAPVGAVGASDPAGLLAGRALGPNLGAGVFTLGRSRPTASAGQATAGGELSKAVQSQISQALAAVLKQKGGVMSLRLNPEDLGSMKIDLAVEAGKVTAVFDAQNEQTRQILRDGLDQLKRSIEQSGLTIQKVEVVNAPPSSASSQNDQNAGSDGRHQHAPGRDFSDSGGSGAWNGPSRDRSARGSAAEVAETGGVGVEEPASPAVWAEGDGAAQGLLRLRVDTLI